jgi:very-short-patch-repair endonuclease
MAHAIDITRGMRGQCRSRGIEAAIVALATRQYGVIARFQLIAIGLSDDAIDRWLASGRLHRLYPGVYAVGHISVAREGRWLAAVLAGGADAVLSHRSAAALWGIRRYEGRPEITVRPGQRARRGVIARRSSLQPDEVTVERGVPATSVGRTIIDLGSVMNEHQLEKAIREAEYLRLFDLVELSRLLERHPRRTGTAALRRAIRSASESRNRTRSDLEDLFIDLLLKANLPTPEINAAIELDTVTIEGDAVWRDRKLVVELDGWQAHGTRSAFEQDRERDLALAAAGWVCARITWRRLENGIPQDLRNLLAQ